MIEITELQLGQFVVFCIGMLFFSIGCWCLWYWKREFNEYSFGYPIMCWSISSIFFFVSLNITFEWVVVK